MADTRQHLQILRQQFTQLQETLKSLEQKNTELKNQNKQYVKHLSSCSKELILLTTSIEKIKSSRILNPFIKLLNPKSQLHITHGPHCRVGNKKEMSYTQSLNKYKKLAIDLKLFDAKWYLEKYPDVKKAKMDPFHHYVNYGAKENRNPNSIFDTQWYSKQYPEVRALRISALEHYMVYGIYLDRDPSPAFSVEKYYKKHPDVKKSKMNASVHYLNYGKKEGRQVFPVESIITNSKAINNEIVTTSKSSIRIDYSSNNKQQALEQENELLLLHLHETQKELEHWYLKAQKNTSKASA